MGWELETNKITKRKNDTRKKITMGVSLFTRSTTRRKFQPRERWTGASDATAMQEAGQDPAYAFFQSVALESEIGDEYFCRVFQQLTTSGEVLGTQ